MGQVKTLEPCCFIKNASSSHVLDAGIWLEAGSMPVLQRQRHECGPWKREAPPQSGVGRAAWGEPGSYLSPMRDCEGGRGSPELIKLTAGQQYTGTGASQKADARVAQT